MKFKNWLRSILVEYTWQFLSKEEVAKQIRAEIRRDNLVELTGRWYR